MKIRFEATIDGIPLALEVDDLPQNALALWDDFSNGTVIDQTPTIPDLDVEGTKIRTDAIRCGPPVLTEDGTRLHVEGLRDTFAALAQAREEMERRG